MYRIRTDFRSKTYEPPPLKALRYLDSRREGQLRFFKLLLTAMAAAGRTLHHLGTRFVEDDRTMHHALQLAQEGLWVPEMLLPFDKLSQSALSVTTHALRDLRSLRLLLVADDAVLLTSMTGRGHVRKLMGEMARLEEVELAFYRRRRKSLNSGAVPEIAIIPLREMFGTSTFAHLRHVCFRSHWLDAEDLCDFLLRHKATLRAIMLGNIKLGGAADAERTSDGLGLPSSQRTASECLCADWILAGEAFQQLRSLEGIAIWRTEPSACEKCLPRMLQAVKIGMNGRPNVYEGRIALQ